ncbi:hypothetical protein [Streptomyces sp. NPDC059378]
MSIRPGAVGGSQVAEFMLHIHTDGTAGWRWHDKPFDEVNR